jgi:hypothetical protein
VRDAAKSRVGIFLSVGCRHSKSQVLLHALLEMEPDFVFEVAPERP